MLYGWLVLDRQGAAELSGVFMGASAICTSFYAWKAKAENLEKIKKSGGQLPPDTCEVEEDDV